MSEEEKQMFNKMIYCNLINGEQALKFNRKYKDLQQKVEQLEKENKELNRMCELYSQSLYNADLTKAEKKVEQLENIRKEAIEECKSVIGNPEHTIVSKNELMKIMLDILNKGE